MEVTGEIWFIKKTWSQKSRETGFFLSPRNGDDDSSSDERLENSLTITILFLYLKLSIFVKIFELYLVT